MLYGIPQATDAPEFDIDTFCTFIPKLKDFVKGRVANRNLYNKFVEMGKKQLNYAYWQEQWEYAISLFVAHHIVITIPESTVSTDEDAAAGAPMSSRSIGNINYNVDLDKVMESNPAYKFYNQSGYGRTLVALSSTRGYPGMIISD